MYTSMRENKWRWYLNDVLSEEKYKADPSIVNSQDTSLSPVWPVTTGLNTNSLIQKHLASNTLPHITRNTLPHTSHISHTHLSSFSIYEYNTYFGWNQSLPQSQTSAVSPLTTYSNSIDNILRYQPHIVQFSFHPSLNPNPSSHPIRIHSLTLALATNL